MAIGTPRSGGRFGNVCAFCHYWNGNAQLQRHKINDVLYDSDAKGRCLSRGNSEERASRPACPQFVVSNEASRYCKL